MYSRPTSSIKDIPSFYIRRPKQPFSGSFNTNQGDLTRNISILKEITNNVSNIDPSRHQKNQKRCKTQHISSQINQIAGDEEYQTTVILNNVPSSRRMSLVPIHQPLDIFQIPRSIYLTSSPIHTRKNITEHKIIQKKYKQEYEQWDKDNLTKSRVKNTSPKSIDWIFDAAKPFDDCVSFETIFLAISIMERYNQDRLFDSDKDQSLFSAVCLFMASKLVDIQSLQMLDIQVYLLNEMHSVHEIYAQELQIIEKLNYQLYEVTLFNRFDMLFSNLFEEMNQDITTHLMRIHHLAISVLKQMSKVNSIEFNDQELAVAIMLYCIHMIMEDNVARTSVHKKCCMQRILKFSNHFELNINQIDRCVDFVSKCCEKLDPFLSKFRY